MCARKEPPIWRPSSKFDVTGICAQIRLFCAEPEALQD